MALRCNRIAFLFFFFLLYSQSKSSPYRSHDVLPVDDQPGREPVTVKKVSMIEQLLPPNQESDLDDIRTCSPYINLYEGKQDQISIFSYVYIKNNKKECFDNNLNLAMRGTLNKPSNFLTKALARDDQKSDTVLCREFVELFKLVDLTGLTQAMCRQRILMDVSRVPFCSTPLPTEVDVQSLVKFFTIDNLFKIASTYQFLIGLHNSTGCERVCGEDDNIFCNAFVHLTLFFVEELKKDRQPPTASTRQATANTYNQYRSVIRKFKATLMSRRTTMKDLLDIQGSLDSPRLLNITLRRIFGMISDHNLVVIQNNLEIVRFMVTDVISHRLTTTPSPTIKPVNIKDYPESDSDDPKPLQTDRGLITLPSTDDNKPRPYTVWGWDVVMDAGTYEWVYPPPPTQKQTAIVPTTSTPSKQLIYSAAKNKIKSQPNVDYKKTVNLLKIVAIFGLVIGTVYVCIRCKRKIRDFVSPYFAKCQQMI